MRAQKPNNFRLKPVVASESLEQIRLSTWLTKNNVLHFHVPNGGKRSISEAVRFKAMGVKAGVPDIFIPVPMGAYHGLWIELKRIDGGTLSDHQKFWINELTRNGYACVVANGAEVAITHVKLYFNNTEVIL